MKVYKAPEEVPVDEYGVSVFLAGSIEMGTAEDWQTVVTEALSQTSAIVYNPRRDDWDSSWEQSIENKQFAEQVNWEQDQLARASVLFFYFSPETKSPITLMELGHALGSTAGPLVVVCPDGFWRKGNVDIMCERAGVIVYDNLQDGVDKLLALIES